MCNCFFWELEGLRPEKEDNSESWEEKRKENCCSKDFCRQIPCRVLMSGNCPSITHGLLVGSSRLHWASSFSRKDPAARPCDTQGFTYTVILELHLWQLNQDVPLAWVQLDWWDPIPTHLVEKCVDVKNSKLLEPPPAQKFVALWWHWHWVTALPKGRINH